MHNLKVGRSKGKRVEIRAVAQYNVLRLRSSQCKQYGSPISVILTGSNVPLNADLLTADNIVGPVFDEHKRR